VRIGILTEFPSLSIQNGPSLQTRLLHDALTARGHFVVLIGPDTSKHIPIGGANTHLFANVPLVHGPAGEQRYPKRPTINVPMPWPPRRLLQSPRLDVLHGQSGSPSIYYGAWLRKLYATAFINTHLIHLPAQIHFLLPQPLYDIPRLREGIQKWVPEFERSYAQLYNQADGLVVQNPHLVEYWENRGVRVPIEVIGRPIDPAIFSRPTTTDPWPESKRPQKRLLCVCRIDREKNLDALIDVFEKEIAGSEPEVTLTLVGDGFERPRLIDRCRRSKYSNRIFFPGEVRHEDLRDWYAHADVFVYTSLSETFGNVVNEALWNGLPVVAFDDRLGVSGQVESTVNGFLIEPSASSASRDFAEAVLRLLRNQELRTRFGQEAQAKARRTAHPDVVLGRYERFYEQSMRRVRHEVSRPLIEAQGVSKAASAFEFTRHVVPWAAWSALLLGLARATVAFESAAHLPRGRDAAE